MATNQSQYSRPAKEPKFRLSKWFNDAPVATEPEEPQKIVVAGMAEAKVVKDYPEGFFKKAVAVFQGEYGKLLRTTVWFLISALLVVAAYMLGVTLFKDYVLTKDGGYNFMSAIGIGYPGIGDSMPQSVASLYWDVYEYVLLMVAGAMIIVTPFMAGQFYAAKRCYHQDFYRQHIRTYFVGFAKYWWKYMITATVGVLIMLAMGTSLLNLLSKQQVGIETAGDYCGVVFAFLFGAPLLTIPMVMCGLFVQNGLSFADTFKNAIVLILNNYISVILCGIASVLPLLLLLIGNVISIIVFVAMLGAGFNFLALLWIALVDRGMTKCHNLKDYFDKKAYTEQRRAQKGMGVVKNNKSTAKPYQNPKKKKKK